MATSLIDRLQDHAARAAELRQTMVGSWPVDLHDDLIEAARELDRVWRDSTLDKCKHNREMDALREQLEIARTEAKDVQAFKDQSARDNQHVAFGMRLAIQAMVEGLKGGGKA